MTVIIEGKLEFTFDDNWQLIKWDDDPAYRKGIGKLDETKAVDVLGLHRENGLYLIEIKDLRVDPISRQEPYRRAAGRRGRSESPGHRGRRDRSAAAAGSGEVARLRGSAHGS